MKIEKGKYGNARPKIEPDDIEEGDAAVFTIAAVEEQTVKGDEGERLSLVLLTEELGDKVLWLNVTQIGYLTEKLGNDSDRWIGQQVPLVKTTTHYAGKAFKKVWVAAPEEWKALLADAGKDLPRPRRRRALAKVKGKRGN
jgi:hypothetical protein